MNGNYQAKHRPIATLKGCEYLVREARALWKKRTQVFTEPTMKMINKKDLDGSRKFLENVIRAWGG